MHVKDRSEVLSTSRKPTVLGGTSDKIKKKLQLYLPIQSYPSLEIVNITIDYLILMVKGD